MIFVALNAFFNQSFETRLGEKGAHGKPFRVRTGGTPFTGDASLFAT